MRSYERKQKWLEQGKKEGISQAQKETAEKLQKLKEKFAQDIESCYPPKDYFSICNTLKDYIEEIFGNEELQNKKEKST